MTPDWTPLETELDRWQDAGLTLPLWWRDDDATAPSPALDRLAALAGDSGLTLHLAVIPEGATGELAARVNDTGHIVPMVHGWAHRNHAPEGVKKAEFAANRELTHMRGEAARGLARLDALFGDRLAPVFVPPWNRIAPAIVGELAGLGFRALSAFGPRKSREAAAQLEQINTHLDPVAWKSGGGLADPDALIAQVARQLADRREGRADNEEPYGLLTHHLVHDEAIWTFTAALVARLVAGPARNWTATDLTRKDTIT